MLPVANLEDPLLVDPSGSRRRLWPGRLGECNTRRTKSNYTNLLPEEHHVELLILGYLGNNLGDVDRLELFRALVIDNNMNGLVRTLRQCSTECLLLTREIMTGIAAIGT